MKTGEEEEEEEEAMVDNQNTPINAVAGDMLMMVQVHCINCYFRMTSSAVINTLSVSSTEASCTHTHTQCTHINTNKITQHIPIQVTCTHIIHV